MRKSWYGPALIVLAALLWGVDGILRRTLYSLPPIVIVFYEHLIGFIILLPFFLRFIRKERFTEREWAALVFVSLLSSVLGTLWFTYAIVATNYISFSVVFLLQKLQPIFAIAGAAMILREKIDRRYIGWAALAIAAAYFVTFPAGRVNFATGSGTLVAAGLAVLAAFAWGFTTPFSRYVLINHKSTAVTGWRFLLAIIFAGILVPFLGQTAALNAVTYNQMLRVLAIALTTGMVALWIYYYGLRFTEAKVSTVLELASPLAAIVIDIFLYHNFLAPSQYLAALVLVYATWRIARLNRAPAAVGI